MVLCFVRNLASPFSRAVMAEIQLRYPDFDREGFSLVVVTPTDLTQARDFVPRHHVLAPVVVDEDGALHRAWQVGSDRALAGSLRSLLQPARVSAIMQALHHGHGRPHRDINQLGAQFVVGSDGRIALAAYDRSIADQPDLESLLECARSL